MKYYLKPVTLIAVVVLCFVSILFAIVPVRANSTIIVTTTNDELNSDGDCSLREAIRAANTDAGSDACLRPALVVTQLFYPLVRTH